METLTLEKIMEMANAKKFDSVLVQYGQECRYISDCAFSAACDRIHFEYPREKGSHLQVRVTETYGMWNTYSFDFYHGVNIVVTSVGVELRWVDNEKLGIFFEFRKRTEDELEKWLKDHGLKCPIKIKDLKRFEVETGGIFKSDWNNFVTDGHGFHELKEWEIMGNREYFLFEILNASYIIETNFDSDRVKGRQTLPTRILLSWKADTQEVIKELEEIIE